MSLLARPLKEEAECRARRESWIFWVVEDQPEVAAVREVEREDAVMRLEHRGVHRPEEAKGGALAAKAVGPQGKGGVLAANAVEHTRQKQCLTCSPASPRAIGR